MLLGGALLCLNGCGDPAPPQNPPPPAVPVPEDVLTEVSGYFETNKKLKFAKLQTDRHKGFFVRRRAQILGSANPSWATEAGHATLKSRIDNEYTQLDAFLTAKAASLDPTTGGTDAFSPPHLDLHDIVKATKSMSAAAVARLEAIARRRRAYRVGGIGWRAAAIHDNLWQASAGATTATLQQPELHTLIDRRLRLIERMNYTISNATALGGPWRFTGSGATGPWKDGFRVRMFEYPRIPHIVVSQVAGFVGAGNIAADTDPSYQPGKAWKWETGHRRLYYNVGPWPGNRFPDNEKNDWTMDSPNYWQKLTPSSTAAAAIDTLFTPNEDWWGRAWLFCDQVLSALHIEGLLFGLRRRQQPASDTPFNSIVTGNPGYVALGAFVDGNPGYGTPHLMHDKNDVYFENVAINEADLQMGDHLIFWNSFVYSDISAGEWRLENSVVIDVDSDPATGGIRRDKLHLQGHGTSERDYATYQRQDIAEPLNGSLTLIRHAIAAAPAGTTSLDWNQHKGLIVKWEPYEPFNAPGSWWVQMNLTDANGKVRWATVADALQAVAGSVATDAAPGTGYTPPPSATAVFFPLYRPNIAGGWTAYLSARRANPAFRAPKNLVAFNADGSIMPGLHYAGQSKPFPVVRPRVY